AEARTLYECEESLFTSSGNVIFPNFRAVRAFTQRLIEKQFPTTKPQVALRAGQMNAMGLIDEIYHSVVRMYDEVENPGVMKRVYAVVSAQIGKERLESMLEAFVILCPPLTIYRGTISVDDYCREQDNLLGAFEELLLLHLANFNPAFHPWRTLFDDSALLEHTPYGDVLGAMESAFEKEKKFGPDHQTLLELLRAPILAHPDSLEAQLLFIRSRWGMVLSSWFLERMVSGMDVLSEESKTVVIGPHDPPTVVPTYKPAGPASAESAYGSHEYERFTADIEWMPRVVLLAKNAYVWLDQLSKKYQRLILRLDEIPDQELDQIARWNFTGLWLIGVWERSIASQKIKNYTGNPDAVPSAYSLYDYEIAADLGGEEAFQNLNRRAWQRGIRLAGDMVPNHMGIFSKWMIERPDYFIQLDYSPFPGYRFTGGNLSDDSAMQIRIEDGYWSRSDASVVFQRIDNQTGAVRYIYHGNDGTNMPWNDTAQLDLLKDEVREAVIQEIFRVARKFSIIRFDAAMTLAKKHYQRLWYPQPGTGGAIPSRSEHALTRERFNELFPREFWRDVVDRINAEMPNTLLLAEAFWLMEGYFVRTLGMHRVYNSAFMHMLMKEENEKYRQLIKNTLEFDPEILKRYVNFMSNPDEQTAIAQFGKDDKYFGIALMMVTLPGLPMFGHGQVEGYTEKYGMEYKRAYYDEYPDDHLVRRHEQEIFPIMQKRHLFSQVHEFELYDFHDSRGFVNENVFAYSNRSGGERALILYHNHYSETRGWIGHSVPKLVQDQDGVKRLQSRSLSEALGINASQGVYYVFRDHKGHLEFLRSGKEIAEEGLFVELKAFHYHVFLDFREWRDVDGSLEHLRVQLEG
ncbi:MAG: alpha-amylase family glycosyl hydrolase, partial [Ignavibacteriales bacterium]|nr:alpha-amylase family glycosyl hydrolase [Ignavibacteriales bacterium]